MAPLVSSILLLLPSSLTQGCPHHGQLLPFLHNQQCLLLLDLSSVLPLSSGRRPRNPKISALSVVLERSTSWAEMISMMGLEIATHVGSSYLGGNIELFRWPAQGCRSQKRNDEDPSQNREEGTNNNQNWIALFKIEVEYLSQNPRADVKFVNAVTAGGSVKFLPAV